MQLDQTRIAIRERSFPDLLDLSLKVVRAHAGPLLAALVVGAVPMALANYWLLVPLFDSARLGDEPPVAYVLLMAFLVVWQIPLATAPLTLYLGQALFTEQPSLRRLLGDLWNSSWQLLLFQVALRGMMVWLCFTWFVLYMIFPYLNEIILLERNPWRSPHPTVISTLQRSTVMHTGMLGDLMVRWLMSLCAGGLMFAALWGGSSWLQSLLFRGDTYDMVMKYTLPLALWLTIGYFTVVRFLAYLDTRIRSEGWEIELVMRAEGARLARQLS